jgi:hypothetical protein
LENYQKVRTGEWDNRAFVIKASDRTYYRILDMIRTLPECYLVFAKSSYHRLIVIEEPPSPPEMPGVLDHRFTLTGMVRSVDSFYRIRDQLSSDGDFWILGQYVKKEGASVNG